MKSKLCELYVIKYIIMMFILSATLLYMYYKGNMDIRAIVLCVAAVFIMEILLDLFSDKYRNGVENSERDAVGIVRGFLYKTAGMRNELKVKNEELKALRDISEIITSTFEVKIITEYIYEIFNKFAGCDRYLIAFADKYSEQLIFKYEFGTIILNETGNSVDQDSIVAKCYESKRTLIALNSFIKSRKAVGDKIAIPLSVSGETVGVIFIESGSAYSFEKVNISFLENLAVYAAISIKNAELFNSLYEQKQEIEALYEETTAVNEELSSYINQLNKTKEELKSKNDELMAYYNEIHTAYLQTVTALSNSIEAKDAYTRGHCQRVMEISCELGKRLGMSESEIEDLRYVAILHDIGKIGVPARILNKQGKLTDDEYNDIKKHPLIAYNILKDVEFIKRGLDGILQHHERYDGRGYPYGIKGESICKLGRILCIADAFDAMTSDRPYRKAMSMREAVNEIERCKGSQFDPYIASEFIQLSKQII